MLKKYLCELFNLILSKFVSSRKQLNSFEFISRIISANSVFFFHHFSREISFSNLLQNLKFQHTLIHHWFLKRNQKKATAKNLTKNANPFSSVFVPLEISLTKQVFFSTFIWQLSSTRRRELANLLESQTYLWFLLIF